MQNACIDDNLQQKVHQFTFKLMAKRCPYTPTPKFLRNLFPIVTFLTS